MLVACIVTMGEHRVLIVCLYNPPNESPYFMAQSSLNILLENVLNHSSQVTSIIIYGDFNLPDIDWKSYSSTTPDNQAFIDLMLDNDLIQIIDFPTAASGILDLIFISKDLDVSSCKIGDESINLLSNHFSILTQLSIPNFKSLYMRPGKPNASFSYCKADFDKLNALIVTKPFQEFVGATQMF